MGVGGVQLALTRKFVMFRVNGSRWGQVDRRLIGHSARYRVVWLNWFKIWHQIRRGCNIAVRIQRRGWTACFGHEELVGYRRLRHFGMLVRNATKKELIKNDVCLLTLAKSKTGNWSALDWLICHEQKTTLLDGKKTSAVLGTPIAELFSAQRIDDWRSAGRQW